MRNKNTMSKRKYVCDSILLFSLLLLVYCSLFLRRLFFFGPALSIIIFLLSAGIGVVSGILLTLSCRRNHTSIICNLLLSVGPYHIISRWASSRNTLVLAGCIAATLVGIHCILVWYVYRQERKAASLSAAGRQWAWECFLSSRTLVAAVFAICLLGNGAISKLQKHMSTYNTSSAAPAFVETEESVETIEKSMDVVLLLQTKEWKQLNTDTKLMVMQKIADIEANHLGIDPVDVSADFMSDTTLGYYHDGTRTIVLNLHLFSGEKSHSALTTLCHEIYHAYQHRLVDLYDRSDGAVRKLLLFRDAARYKDEFANYIDSSTDYDEYCGQQCEMDSDQYAADALITYSYHINQYNAQNNICVKSS